MSSPHIRAQHHKWTGKGSSIEMVVEATGIDTIPVKSMEDKWRSRIEPQAAERVVNVPAAQSSDQDPTPETLPTSPGGGGRGGGVVDRAVRRA